MFSAIWLHLTYNSDCNKFLKSLTFSLQRQRIQAIETEIEGYRKSISKAQEQNEQITLMHNKIEADISMVKKLIAVSRNKQEVLKTEYSKYSRTLHETEQQLNRAETVRVICDICIRVLWYCHVQFNSTYM